jgi:hypothetical protein
MSEKTVGAFTAGTITQADFDLLRKLVGKPGQINLPNERIEYDAGSVVLVLPESFSGVCTHDNGVRRAEFTTLPEVKYGVISQSCKAIVISGDSIMFELPWAPDLKLTIEG